MGEHEVGIQKTETCGARFEKWIENLKPLLERTLDRGKALFNHTDRQTRHEESRCGQSIWSDDGPCLPVREALQAPRSPLHPADLRLSQEACPPPCELGSRLPGRHSPGRGFLLSIKCLVFGVRLVFKW